MFRVENPNITEVIHIARRDLWVVKQNSIKQISKENLKCEDTYPTRIK